jgi:protein-tyrosine phosphatase
MAVCDLRSADERRSEPAPFPTEGAMMVTAFDYDMAETMASIGALMRAKTRAEAVAAFSAGYVEMANFLAPHFTDMFAKLLAGQTPLAMNCSAGKDRTGMAAAMILSVLGVERESVIEDYALSETYVPPDKYIDEMRNAGSSSSGSMTPQMAQVFAQMPDPVLRVLMGTDADVMRLTLAELDSKAGGPIAFAKAKYGLTDASISQLRSMYLA